MAMITPIIIVKGSKPEGVSSDPKGSDVEEVLDEEEEEDDEDELPVPTTFTELNETVPSTVSSLL
jgi:hypothetical protein